MKFPLESGKTRARFAAVAILCIPIMLAGCSLTPLASPTPNQSQTIHGIAHGGRQAITGAHVYLYAAGASGYQSSATSLLTSNVLTNNPSNSGKDGNGNYYVTTDSNGNFTITSDYTCAPGTGIYLYLIGGNSGGGANSAIGLLAILGTCPDTSTFASATPFVFMNEVSTVAAAYSLAAFAADATHISSGNFNGIRNAFVNAANLANISSGNALSTTPAGNGTVPQQAINTLANILAACINSAGSSSSACTTLFGTLSSGSTGVTATDTATAAIYISHNPASHVAALYGLNTANPPFFPNLTAQPSSFSLAINFTGSGFNSPSAIAIDAYGNAWVANALGNSVTELTNSGSSETGSPYTGNGLNKPSAIAIDATGNAWIANASGNSITEISSTGIAEASSPFSDSSLNGPTDIAIDYNGNVWIANAIGNSITELSSTGSAVTGSPYMGSGESNPSAIAMDASGNAWIANANGNSITELSSAGNAVNGSPFTGRGLSRPSGVAIDGSGNIWVTNAGGNSVTELTSTGTAVAGSPYTGLSSPAGIAIDGSGNAWIANTGNNSVAELNSAGTAVAGSPYTGSGISGPSAIAIDASGDAWIANAGNNSVTEIMGIAGPAAAPVGPGLAAQKISPPTAGAYLGASVNPAQGSIDLETQAETLEGQIGRRLALHMHYYGWSNSGVATFPDQIMNDDPQYGRIPIVSWGCGHKDTAITAGTYDSQIDAEAAAIKAFGSPIFLRWFWEFNNDGASQSEKATDCLNSSDPLATQQANFIAAWIHIWQRFQTDGVTNVTWLWNPAGTGGSAAGFYPGNQYVDWIGDDDYGDITTSNPNGGFDGAVGGFYNKFSTSTYAKPLMIGETGGCPSVNATYINSAGSDIPTKYPDFRAFVYWDSVGTYLGCPSGQPWVFTSDGLTAFATMGALPYFSLVP